MAQAICSYYGCLVGDVAPVQAGVQLEISGESSPSSVWLLPGNYSPAIPALNGDSSPVLAPFLGAGVLGSNETAGEGWSLFALSEFARSVRVGLSFSNMVAYTGPDYTGTPVLSSVGGQTGQSGLRSIVLDNTTFGVFSIAGNREMSILQVWDSVPDTTQLGLGDVTLQLEALESVSSATNSTANFCQRGFYLEALRCWPCLACSTCWNATKCLSCSSTEVLVNGTCEPAHCAGNIEPAPGMGICLESLIVGTTASASRPSSKPVRMSPAIIAAVAISSVVGALLVAFTVWKVRWFCGRRHHARSPTSSDAPLMTVRGGLGDSEQAQSVHPPLATPLGSQPRPYHAYSPPGWYLTAPQPPVTHPLLNYPHFGAHPVHSPYHTTEQLCRDVRGEHAEQSVSRPLTYLGIPRLKKRKNKRRRRAALQSAWLRRLTDRFGDGDTPPVPPIPSHIYEATVEGVSASTQMQRDESPLAEPTAPLDDLMPTRRVLRDVYSPGICASPTSTHLPAKAMRMRRAQNDFPGAAKPFRSGDADPLEPSSKQARKQAMELSAAASKESPEIEEDLMSERRRKVTTRLAQWLAESCPHPLPESEVAEALRLNGKDGTKQSTSRLAERTGQLNFKGGNKRQFYN